jgi:hypothetical protein
MPARGSDGRGALNAADREQLQWVRVADLGSKHQRRITLVLYVHGINGEESSEHLSLIVFRTQLRTSQLGARLQEAKIEITFTSAEDNDIGPRIAHWAPVRRLCDEPEGRNTKQVSIDPISIGSTTVSLDSAEKEWNYNLVSVREDWRVRGRLGLVHVQ